MPRAVFLDRDGVLNRLILNPQTGQYESPHVVADFQRVPGMERSLRQLVEAGYLLFLISNQPSYALGKTSLENIRAIHDLLEQALLAAGVAFTEYYYCYHHPQGKVPGYSGECQCRKPSPYFIHAAEKKFALDLSQSFFIGDQDRDSACGQAAGVRTIIIEVPESAAKRGQSRPDYTVASLSAAVAVVLANGKAEP